MAGGEFSSVKTPFIEKWERDIEELMGTNSGLQDAHYLGDPDEELLAPHSTMVIPPLGYTDFIKEGLKDAGILQVRRDFFTGEGEDSPSNGATRTAPSAAPAAAGNPQPQQETQRKELHNATEKRRREKINGKLTELRDAIPLAAGTGANKTTVLRATVDHIRALNAQYTQLLAMNRQLQETNAHLLNELRDMHRLLWTRARDSLQQGSGGPGPAPLPPLQAPRLGLPPHLPPPHGSTDNSSPSTVHSSENVYDMPFKIIARPLPPQDLDEAKVQSMMRDLQKDPARRDTVPPIDVLWLTGEQNPSNNYYISFGGCHRYEAFSRHRRLCLPTIRARLVRSTPANVRVYLGSSTPNFQ